MLGIWIHRNREIFENHLVNIHFVINKITTSFQEQKTSSRTPKVKVLKDPSFSFEYHSSFFYGECQGIQRDCGEGMIIYLYLSSYYKLKLGVGGGTNTKVELLALWGLIFYANQKGIGRI